MARFVLVGLGHVSSHIVDATKQVSGLTLTGGMDCNSEKKIILPDNVRFFDSAESVWSAGDADIIYIATPTRTHVEVAAEFARRGYFIAVEKPIAPNRTEFNQLAIFAGSRYYTAFHASFGAEIEWLRSEQSGLLAKTKFVSCYFADPYIDKIGLASSAYSLIDPWTDSGINALSVICRLFPDRSFRPADFRTTIDPTRGDQTVSAFVQFVEPGNSEPLIASIACDWTLGDSLKVTKLVLADGGEVILDHSGESAWLRESGGSAHRQFAGQTSHPRLTNHYRALLGDLLSHYRCGTSNIEFSNRAHNLFYDASEYGRERGHRYGIENLGR